MTARASSDGKSEQCSEKEQANHLQKYVKVLNIQNIVRKKAYKIFFPKSSQKKEVAKTSFLPHLSNITSRACIFLYNRFFLKFFVI
jgi:hypothetical protein